MCGLQGLPTLVCKLKNATDAQLAEAVLKFLAQNNDTRFYAIHASDEEIDLGNALATSETAAMLKNHLDTCAKEVRQEIVDGWSRQKLCLG